ncbi:MAG: hypothetical protein ACYC90_00370 [Candidatus Nanopelagicales bacterium]
MPPLNSATAALATECFASSADYRRRATPSPTTELAAARPSFTAVSFAVTLDDECIAGVSAPMAAITHVVLLQQHSGRNHDETDQGERQEDKAERREWACLRVVLSPHPVCEERRTTDRGDDLTDLH